MTMIINARLLLRSTTRILFNKPYITVLVVLEKQDNDYVLHLVRVSHLCLMPKLWQEQVTFDEVVIMFTLY